MSSLFSAQRLVSATFEETQRSGFVWMDVSLADWRETGFCPQDNKLKRLQNPARE